MKVGQIKPIAFKIFRNGRSICTAGLRGRPGVISAVLHWVDREGLDELALQVGGLDSATREHVTWVSQSLRIGDEVVIRLVESVKTTRVRSRIKAEEKLREKQEKAWLRKTAKKYGYRLVKLG